MTDRDPVPLDPAHEDPATARICLDRAFQDWDGTGDVQVVDALAPLLRELYARHPDHRPDADEAIDRRLRRAASLTVSGRVPLHDIRSRAQ
ncbi:hypothetical protein [Streptomyces coelicoflavus]|uniref:hypothetical protein n=1 Tax=Streptomyces coelicoflavus TaxID=285562 RepID=UPI002E25F9EE